MFGPVFIVFIMVVSFAALAAYRMRLSHQLRLRELELQGLSKEAPTLPPIQTEALLQGEAVEALPAYVDPADQASMDAWNEAQQELEKSW